MGMGSVALTVKPSFLGGILAAIFERNRTLAHRNARANGLRTRAPDPRAVPELTALCVRLISDQYGEASRVAMAGDILARWSALPAEGQRDFLLALGSGFGP